MGYKLKIISAYIYSVVVWPIIVTMKSTEHNSHE